MGFAQTYPEYHIMQKRLPINNSNIEVIEDVPSKRQINLRDAKEIGRLDYPAHMVYFGNITACGPGLEKSLLVLVGLSVVVIAAAGALTVSAKISKDRDKEDKIYFRSTFKSEMENRFKHSLQLF
jgi:hypothetical protein